MFAVIYIPQFALQAALRHEPELWAKPLALVDPARSTPVVCDLTDVARQKCVTEGLTPTQATARCGGVVIRHRVLPQETAAANAILHCAYGFSPNIEATAPGLCTLDLRGLATLANADTAKLVEWAGQLRSALSGQNLRARVGLGPTPNIARHAAIWSEGIAIADDPKAFVASLPVAALEPSSDVAIILDKWGIRTVGELLALGQEALVDRLGLEALALFATASTTATRPLKLVRPSERFEESFEFEDAVETVEPLLFILRRFGDQLSRRLELNGLVAELLTFRLRLESGQLLERRLRIPQPTRQPDILFRMLHTHLDPLRTDSPIKSVALTVSPTQPEQKQFSLFEAALRDPNQFQETLARLSALLGAERVGSPVLEDSHRPDAFRMVPPDFENAPSATEKRQAPALRPVSVRRFRPAIKAAIETADGNPRPVSVRCSAAKGRLNITVGPCRSSGNWWKPLAWEREEWDAAITTGKVLRLVKQSEGWFVEGELD